MNEGAPVKYRGVTIGSVKRVMVRFNQATNDYAMPVILEMQEELLRERLGEPPSTSSPTAAWRSGSRHGLRASLQTESLVTGVLYVDIRPNPNAPPPVFHQLQKIYPELPTEPTQIQQLFNNLASLDIKSIETNLNALLTKLDTTVGESEHGGDQPGHHQPVGLPEPARHLPGHHQRPGGHPADAGPIPRAGREAHRPHGPAGRQRHQLARRSQPRPGPDPRRRAKTCKSMLAPDSPVRNDLDLALEQLAGAAQSISALVDFLKQHPNALITGRQIPKKTTMNTTYPNLGLPTPGPADHLRDRRRRVLTRFGRRCFCSIALCAGLTGCSASSSRPSPPPAFRPDAPAGHRAGSRPAPTPWPWAWGR